LLFHKQGSEVALLRGGSFEHHRYSMER